MRRPPSRSRPSSSSLRRRDSNPRSPGYEPGDVAAGLRRADDGSTIRRLSSLDVRRSREVSIPSPCDVDGLATRASTPAGSSSSSTAGGSRTLNNRGLSSAPLPVGLPRRAVGWSRTTCARRRPVYSRVHDHSCVDGEAEGGGNAPRSSEPRVFDARLRLPRHPPGRAGRARAGPSAQQVTGGRTKSAHDRHGSTGCATRAPELPGALCTRRETAAPASHITRRISGGRTSRSPVEEARP